MLDIHIESQEVNEFLSPKNLVLDFDKEKMGAVLTPLVALPIPENIKKVSFKFNTALFHKGILGSFYLLDENNEPISDFDLYNNSKNGEGHIDDFVDKVIDKMLEDAKDDIEEKLAEYPKDDLYESHKKRLIEEEKESLYRFQDGIATEANFPLETLFTVDTIGKLFAATSQDTK